MRIKKELGLFSHSHIKHRRPTLEVYVNGIRVCPRHRVRSDDRVVDRLEEAPRFHMCVMAGVSAVDDGRCRNPARD